MARLNTRVVSQPIFTAEGARAKRITPIQQLERLVLASFLWEDSFYVDGKTTAQYIQDVLPLCKPEEVAVLAIKARLQQKLRHMPLLLVREMARMKNVPRGLVAVTLTQVIERVDEIAEFVAIYWKDGKQPLSAQVKQGLADAFNKFDAYQFAKYDRDHAIKLRDVAFLVHPKPKDEEHAEIFARLLNKDHYPEATKSGFEVKNELGLDTFSNLEAADTWENRLSSSEVGEKKSMEDKKETWTGLLQGRKLGALALLRNLRNMNEAGVDEKLIRNALVNIDAERVLPFRFISAAKYAPKFEAELETAMFRCLSGMPGLPGKTVLLVDNSGSMHGTRISKKSEIDRAAAAAAVAMLLREICESVEIVVFGTTAGVIKPRRGFAMRDEIRRSAYGGRTNTETAKQLADSLGYDRIIILTDEQSHQNLSAPKGLGYVINVANEKNGIGYGAWNHIDGWSEGVIDYIIQAESFDEQLA